MQSKLTHFLGFGTVGNSSIINRTEVGEVGKRVINKIQGFNFLLSLQCFCKTAFTSKPVKLQPLLPPARCHKID